MLRVRAFIKAIDYLNDKVGSAVCLMILAMMLILVWEVIMRYGFNAPTFWAHESSQYFFGAHFIIGGAYALRWGSHVNVEVLYGRLTPRAGAILDLFTWSLFYLFCGFLLWRGGEAAWLSVSRWEHSYSVWAPPFWPLRLTIPLAAILILLQGVTKTVKDIYTAITGRKFVIEVIERGEL